MITFLPSVNPHQVHPSIWVAVGVAYVHRLALTHGDMVVTSMNDGTHMDKSLHYASSSPDKLCRAVDLRTHDMYEPLRPQWFAQVKATLDPLGFDVVLHDGKDGLPIHLHIEYQPKNEQEGEWMKGQDNPNPNVTKIGTPKFGAEGSIVGFRSVIIALLLLLSLVSPSDARIKRSKAAIHQFKVMTGYPHGRKGYVVDHIVPLACNGPDSPYNMQWQTVIEGKKKDGWELNCPLSRKLAPEELKIRRRIYGF